MDWDWLDCIRVCVCDVLGLIEWLLLYWVKSNLKGWKAKVFVDGLTGYATKQP